VCQPRANARARARAVAITRLDVPLRHDGLGDARAVAAAPPSLARPVLRRGAGKLQMRSGDGDGGLSVRISQAVVGFGAAAALFASPGIFPRVLAQAARRPAGV